MQAEVDPDLYVKAERDFGGTSRPDYDDFCLGPLAAVVFACESGHVRAHPLEGFAGTFTTVLPASGLFPPVVFSLALLDAGEVWYVYDFVVDHDYWDLVSTDP